jgi:hypothetical protein
VLVPRLAIRGFAGILMIMAENSQAIMSTSFPTPGCDQLNDVLITDGEFGRDSLNNHESCAFESSHKVQCVL